MTNLLTVVANVFSNTLILLLQNVSAKATHIFSAKIINVFAKFQEKVTLAYNFIKFLTTGPRSLEKGLHIQGN